MYTNLLAARATGARSVYYGDKRVDYQSAAEMDSLLAEMEADLGLRKKSRSRMIRSSFTKGLQ